MGRYLFSPKLSPLRAAGFQTCRAADFQIGTPHAGLGTRDPADLEACATLNRYGSRLPRCIRTALITQAIL